MHSLASTHSIPQVEVIALSPREWRISDPTKVERDGRALLGFVELVGTQYEATALCEPRRRTVCRSFDDALVDLVRRSAPSAA